MTRAGQGDEIPLSKPLMWTNATAVSSVPSQMEPKGTFLNLVSHPLELLADRNYRHFDRHKGVHSPAEFRTLPEIGPHIVSKDLD